jgi:hypothetical protein
MGFVNGVTGCVGFACVLSVSVGDVLGLCMESAWRSYGRNTRSVASLNKPTREDENDDGLD